MTSTLTSTLLSTWLPILQEALTREGRFRFPLHGTSMRPTLPTVCQIEIVPLPAAPADVPLGALIVYAHGDALIAHRLVRRTAGAWILQGDGRLAPDRPVAPGQVLGVVAAAYAGERRIWPLRAEGLVRWLWIARHQALRPARTVWRRLHGRR